MPRILTSADPRDDDRTDQQMEDKLQELQKKYREMLNKHQQFSIETDRLMRKQRKEIEHLTHDKNELTNRLQLCESQINARKDQANTKQLQTIAETREAIDREIELETERLQAMEENVREWRLKVSEVNKNKGGFAQHDDWVRSVGRETKVLQNRLTQANAKFNMLMTDNRHFREEIEDLKYERIKYENIKRKRQHELDQLRRTIAEAIEQSTHHYEARDEAQAKLQLLKEKNEKDKLQHDSEMKELCRELDHDKRLKEFMDTKCSDRKEDPTLVEWRKRKEEQELAKKREGPQETVEAYEEAFERIKEMTGEDSLEQLVERFIEKEDQNFASFNYVSELSNMIELLQEQISQISSDIEKFKNEETELEEQRKVILKELESATLEYKDSISECDQSDRHILKVLDQLRSGIESMFDRTGCDHTMIERTLGSSEGVTIDSMLHYLGIVEQRASELLHMDAAVKISEQQAAGKAQPVQLIGAGTDTKMVPTQPLPPGLQEIDAEPDVLDDEDHPFSRDELMAKVSKNVERSLKDNPSAPKDTTALTGLSMAVSSRTKPNKLR